MPGLRSAPCVVSLVLVAGCGAGVIVAEEGEAASEATTESGDSTSSGDGDTSGDGDGDSTGDGDGDGDPTGDGDGDPVCAEPEEVSAGFTVTPSAPISGNCSLTGESIDDSGHYEMSLDCEGEAVTISTDASPPIGANPGVMVVLDYREAPNGPSEDRWLAVHAPGEQGMLVLGGVSASLLDPPGTTLAEFFRVPAISLAAAQPCEIGSDDCGEFQRLALEVSVDDLVDDLVFDRTVWYVDVLAFGFHMVVGEATRREPPVTCEDLTDQWFSLLVKWFPSD